VRERFGKDKEGSARLPEPKDVFKKWDTNGDGSLSMEEFKAGSERVRARVRERFQESSKQREYKRESREVREQREDKPARKP
jgi:hypothetical protein